MQLNKIFVAGNLTRDPETKFTANEMAIAKFSLALNSKWKAKDGTLKEEVTYLDVSAFGRTAELVGQYLTKGSQCLVEGRIKQESWEDKEGNKKSKIVVIAENVQFIGNKKEAAEPSAAQPAQTPRKPAPAPVSNEDSPPF